MDLITDKIFHKEKTDKYKILVVDDQPINIHVIFSILQEEYDVYMANNGHDAIAFCQQSMPDLILADINMPEMSGIELCRELKALEYIRDIPIIFITANQSTVDESLCWDSGGVDFVVKPVNPVTLKKRIHYHVIMKEQTDVLASLAYIDGLTGISNRRFFDEQLEKECRRHWRINTPLSLIMVDVDFFKKYNDNYGHQAGDECLKKIAFLLQKITKRAFDVLARYGGEEFVYLLPETDAIGALNIAKQIETSMRGLSIAHEYSSISNCVTLSIGVATVEPNNTYNASQILELVDKQLYQAKTEGRAKISAVVC